MKRTKMFLLLILSTSGGIILLLTLVAPLDQNYRYASFDRDFEGLVELDQVVNLDGPGYYFAGHTEYNIYLANKRRPDRLMRVGKSLFDTAFHQLRVDNDSMKFMSIVVNVDSPYFFLADRMVGFIYKGHLDNIGDTHELSLGFKHALPISRNSYGLIAISDMETTLGKVVLPNSRPNLFPNILQKQGEGIFSTDGLLRYDKKAGQLVYLYYYRNEYILMDTSFNVVCRGRTIDTVSQAKIEVGMLRARRAYTMTSPALVTNRNIAISDDHIYIHSKLLSKSEVRDDFDKSSVIDVYDTQDARYVFSFYLPKYQEERPKDYIVIGDIIIVLYDMFLVQYRIKRTPGTTYPKETKTYLRKRRVATGAGES